MKNLIKRNYILRSGSVDGLINLKQIVEYSNLSQAIQMIVWQYMSLPKRKRDGVEMADKIIKLIKR